MKESIENLIIVYRFMADVCKDERPYGSSVYTMVADDLQEILDRENK